MTYLKPLDAFRNSFHRVHYISNQPRLLIGREQPEQIACLRVVIVALAVIVPADLASRLIPQLTIAMIFHRTAETVRLIIRRIPAVIVKAHEAIPAVGMHRAL